jgi:hypothetical protein
LKPAHTILVQACQGVLLQIHVEERTRKGHPLARYVAEHRTTRTHTQFGEVSSRLQKGMRYLFDADKPHFLMCGSHYDIDTEPGIGATFQYFTPYYKSHAAAPYITQHSVSLWIPRSRRAPHYQVSAGCER